MTVAALRAVWLERAETLRPYAPAAAEAFSCAATELAEALRADATAELTLSEAAHESGFSADHLRHLIAAGDIPNAGKKGAPRVRRGDLPRKASSTAPYDAAADALSLVRRQKAAS